MKFFSLSSIIFCFLLSACSNQKEIIASGPHPVTVEIPVPGSSNDATTSKKQTNTRPARQHVSNNTQQADILDRVRQGFRFPEYHSKDVRRYEKWNSTHPTYLNALLSRAEPFLYSILEEIDKRQLPTELALVPAIESAFKPRAISRSGAAGLWQFIPSTGRGFQLYRSYWYEDRQDFIKSTKAGLDYLKQLNVMFKGDWLLTLAAYNAGPGTISRAIKKNKRLGKKWDYKNLDLRDETRRYVPKLQALKNIILNPEKYRVSLNKMDNTPFFIKHSLDTQINLQKLSKQIGVNSSVIQHLNAGFRRWPYTGPKSYTLLLPKYITPNLLSEKVSLLSQQTEEYYITKKHDTLSSIAQNTQTSVTQLKQINGLTHSNIQVGQKLKLPNKNLRESRHTAKNKHLKGSHLKQRKKVIHHVNTGDTLWSISRRYKVKLEQLLSWNQLRHNDILNLNQALLIFIP